MTGHSLPARTALCVDDRLLRSEKQAAAVKVTSRAAAGEPGPCRASSRGYATLHVIFGSPRAIVTASANDTVSTTGCDSASRDQRGGGARPAADRRPSPVPASWRQLSRSFGVLLPVGLAGLGRCGGELLGV